MKQRIGIVGGGQLGRMLTEAAHKLGFLVTVLDPMPDSPGGQVADAQIIGSFKGKDKIFELADISDFITFEIELANAEALEELISRGVAVNPEPKVLKIIKDKFEQKVFLRDKMRRRTTRYGPCDPRGSSGTPCDRASGPESESAGTGARPVGDRDSRKRSAIPPTTMASSPERRPTT